MIFNSSIKYDHVLQPLLKMLPQLDSYVCSYFSIHEVDFFYYNTLILTTFRPILEEKRRIIRARKWRSDIPKSAAHQTDPLPFRWTTQKTYGWSTVGVVLWSHVLTGKMH